MGLVALTVGCLALGAYMGRDLTGGAGLALSVGAVICLLGLGSARPTGAITHATFLFGLGLPGATGRRGRLRHAGLRLSQRRASHTGQGPRDSGLRSHG